MRFRSIAVIVCIVAVVSAAAWRWSERTRVIEGTWLYLYEGSDFFEKQSPGHECDLYRYSPGWLSYDPTKVYPTYTYKKSFPSSGTYRRPNGEWRLEGFVIRFEGRKRLMPFGTGGAGLGGWSSEYEVDRMLSIKPVGGLNCNVR